MDSSNSKIDYKAEAQKGLLALKNEGFPWKAMEALIDEAIQKINESFEGKLLTITPKNYQKGWQNVIEEKGGSRVTPTQWQDLYKVWKYLSNDSTESITNPAKNTEVISNQPFTYCTPKLQDTILPYLYRHFYKEFKNIKFEINKDWNEILEAFKTKDIHVAINNFSTALAITRSVRGNPAMFFFPCFLFKGYGIVVKKSSVESFCIKHGIRNNGFNRLSPDNKMIFLEDSTTTLEPKTDVEWVYKNFCVKYDADWDIVKGKIKSFDVNEGKQNFKLKKGTDIYCTNSIHLADLGKQSDKYEIIKNDEVTQHKNVNGILCTMDFFNKNSTTIKELIFTWYHHIVEFIKEKDGILHDSHVAPFTSDLLKGFNDSLNTYTHSTLSLHELMISYRTNNDFFTDASKAFNEFYTADFVAKHTIDKSFWEIANVQLGKEGEDNMEEIISELYNNMKEAFNKINNG